MLEVSFTEASAATLVTATADGIPDLPGLWGLTPWGALLGLFTFMFLGIMRGWVIPKSSHEREIAILNAQIDHLNAANKDQRMTIAEKDKQIGQLLEVGRTVQAFFKGAGSHLANFEDTEPVGGAG